MSVEIRRGSARFVEREPGRLTQHAFSFGADLDPERISFGPMVCHDEHLLGRSKGFETHRHENLEIVTAVLQGALVHTGQDGVALRLEAGEVAVLSSRSGTEHAELAADDSTAHFIQVWLAPRPEDQTDGPSTYARTAIDAVPGAGLVAAVGPEAPLSVAVEGARLWIARLDGLETLTLPAGGRVHAHVASGALLRSSLAEPLAAGDAFLLTDEPEHTVTAAVPTLLLVWQFAA